LVKNLGSCPPRSVEALAGWLLAETISRVGTIGTLPVSMCPSRKASRLTGVGALRPVPK
jgi:hypothetical protein